jgi:hypothetical protein
MKQDVHTDKPEEIVDAQLLAETQAYIRNLEVCSLCGRVTTCRPIPESYGWQCDGGGCQMDLLWRFGETI